MNSIILKHDYIYDLLTELIKTSTARPTDLVICSDKETFLRQVLVEHDQRSNEVCEDVTIEPGDEPVSDPPTSSNANNLILSTTLQVLSTSRNTRLVFCPTLLGLRGYLSGCLPALAEPAQSRGPLIILNLLALHHETSEFTLQGLSHTFATAVSAAHRTRRALNLVECKDIEDPENPNRGSPLWHTEVQLLSAAIKIGQEGQKWGRRTISIAKIASRWFVMEEATQPPAQSEDGAWLEEQDTR
jgi:hypothetical protein